MDVAIEAQFLNLFKQALELRRNSTSSPLQALCLAYPDLLITKATLVEMFGDAIVSRLPVRADADAIWKWHGIPGCKEPLYDSPAFFKALGVDTQVIDIVAARGIERVVDLNQPLPQDLEARFDFVIDTGTCEHCFNVGQAFQNACAAVNVGGFLIHAAPMNKMNHGFWNFSPTVYPDFFEENGFKISYLSGMSCNLIKGYEPFAADTFKIFSAGANTAIFVVAKRIERRPLKWPTQRKYRVHPP